MRRTIATILITCFCLFNAQIVKAQTLENNRPVVNAQAAILMDATTGEVLFEQNASQKLAMASTTKIMTAILALEKGNLDAQVTVSPTVLDRRSVYGTRIYLEPGEQLTLRNLLYALLLNSANDAAVAIAEHIAGSVDNFVKMMNDKAKEIGAANTNFMNPHGLTENGHYSCARDLALFARYGLQNPVFAQIVKTKEAEIPRAKAGLPTKLDNINHMLWLYEGIDGVKTGYTAEAGNCVVESATRNGRQLIVVILKSTATKAMYKDAENLFDYGFASFENKLIASKGQVMDSVSLANGKVLKLTLPSDVFATVSRGDTSNFTFQAKATNINLPIVQGEPRGELQVYKQGLPFQTVPLVAAEKVDLPLNLQIRTNLYLEWAVLAIITFILTALYIPSITRRRKRLAARAREYGYYQD
jgi:serine-type D-Ala-D-Ala carboxypeptidase (penicillin-binding protein 5/6)